MVAVLLIILTNQYNAAPDQKTTKKQLIEKEGLVGFSSEIIAHLIPLTNVFQWSSLYIVIGKSRILLDTFYIYYIL